MTAIRFVFEVRFTFRKGDECRWDVAEVASAGGMPTDAEVARRIRQMGGYTSVRVSGHKLLRIEREG